MSAERSTPSELPVAEAGIICPPRKRKPDRSLVGRVRALHISERNGYGPGDCHCDECVALMDELAELDLEIAVLKLAVKSGL